MGALQNLRNHTLLATNKDSLSKLESIVKIDTFDEVPIFGGQQFREERLEQLAAKSDDSPLVQAVHAMLKVGKSVGCHAENSLNFLMRGVGRGKLGYGSFCEEIPENSSRLLQLHETVDVDMALQ